MRKINYRGKRVDNGEWVYGYYVNFEYFTPMDRDGNERYRNQELIENKDGRFSIDRETVGQFTGLHDKNGVEIYEGDVVFDSQKKLKGHITFLLQEMGFVIVYEKFDSKLGHRSRGGGYDFDVTLEVIGNIHDQEVSDE